MERYIVTRNFPERRYGFAKPLDPQDDPLDYMAEVFFFHGDVRVVEYDNVVGGFYLSKRRTVPLNAVQHIAFRAPSVDDVLMATVGFDLQGRRRLTAWTYLAHYEDVDARQSRCAENGCNQILGYNDEKFCGQHQLGGYEEDLLVPLHELEARAYSGYADEVYDVEAPLESDTGFVLN